MTDPVTYTHPDPIHGFVNGPEDIKAAMNLENIVEPTPVPEMALSPVTPSSESHTAQMFDTIVKHDKRKDADADAAAFPSPSSKSSPIPSVQVIPSTPVSPGDVTDIQEQDNEREREHDSNADTIMVDGEDTGDGDGDAAAATGVTASAPREFVCMNDEYSECKTGQVTKALSRKVISNHFGRNKACTRIITDWPLFCRKHYQRATYKPQLWQRRKVSLILRQFDVIENQHPGTTYDVALKKAEEARLNEFSRKVAGGMPIDKATNAVAPDTKVKSFQAPIPVLRELEMGLGKNKSIDEVKDTVNIILDMLNNGETAEVPSIEFLPNIPKTKATTARVSTKGGVQKTKKV